jgi:hypothetical protein
MKSKLLTKQQALADYLNIDVSKVKQDINGNYLSTIEGAEYLVGDDLQANRFAREDIFDSMWAFKAEFIADHTHMKLTSKAIECIEHIQEKLCEDANDLIKAMVFDLHEFVADAIQADGRGHFLASYDFKEIKLAGGLFAYRTN